MYSDVMLNFPYLIVQQIKSAVIKAVIIAVM